MFRRLLALAAVAAAVAAVVSSSRTSPSGGRDRQPSAAAAKVYGTTVQAPRATVVDVDDEIRRVARRWATEWAPAGTCGDERAMRRVLALSTGPLRDALQRQPPRQTAGVRCQRRGRVLSVLVVDDGHGQHRAIVERPGEAGGDSHLELEITMTADGPRASGLHY